MSLILNIETATPVCSVCISEDGKELVSKEIREGQAHAESLTLLIQDALSASGLTMNQLDAVAVSNGPGSYTGLRIGLSVAKGICYALDKKLITLNSLEVLAWGTFQKTGRTDVLYCPMIDARRMEVYTALYDFEATPSVILETQAKIIDEHSFHDFFEAGHRIIFSGNGASKCQSIVNNSSSIYEEISSSASFMSLLSQKSFICKIFSDLSYIAPSYLKKPNITRAKKKL